MTCRRTSDLFVRALFIACVAALVAPAPAAAQSFEGVISFEATANEITSSFDYYVKGSQVRIVVGASGRQGAAVIIDSKKNLATMLVPGASMYMEFDLAAAASAKGNPPAEGIVLTRTGRTDEIAGQECEEFLASSQSMKAEVWAVAGFGTFMQFDPSPKSSRPSLSLERKLAQQGLFPLRMVVRDLSGKEQSRFEAKRIDERSLDSRLFAIPTGWKKMDLNTMPK